MEKEFKILKNSELTKNLTPKDINQKIHILTPCFMIALYRVLKEIPSIEVSLKLIKNLMMDIFQEFVGPLAEMQKTRLKHANDRWNKYKEQTIFGTNNTYNSFDPIFIKNNETTLEFHLKKCVFYDIFKAHGETHLAPILCYYDNIFADAVEEWISFKRPKTIADGENYCQFIYSPK